MIDCHNISFSPELQQQRLTQVQRILGNRVVQRLLCFALYLLGVQRSSIALALDVPPGTVRSVIRAVLHDGLPAFEDRRRGSSTFLPSQQSPPNITVERREQAVCVNLDTTGRLEIPAKNHFQARVVLLTMLSSNLLRTRDVSTVLGVSAAHTLHLAGKLHSDDIGGLIDKRQGQKQEYRFSAEVKAELIQQFVLDIVVAGRVSGKLLAAHLNERCQLNLSERSVRDQLGKLGLSKIKRSLPDLLKGFKKTSTASS